MKQKRYWLKGAILFTGISLLVTPVSFLFGLFGLPGIGYFAELLRIVDYPLNLLSSGFMNTSDGFLLVNISHIILCFVYGSIIGYIYGKIKTRNITA